MRFPRYYIIDGRAAFDINRAHVLSMEDDLAKAHARAFDYGDDCWIYDNVTEELTPAVKNYLANREGP